MKNKRLIITALVVAVIFTAGIDVFAQRGNRTGAGYSCCMNIPGLTEKQKTEISNLEQQHRKEIDALRTEWRRSANYTAREQHLAEVGRKVEEHRNAVRKLLNEEQKAAIDNVSGRYGRNRIGMNSRGTGRCPGCQGYCRQGGRFGRVPTGIDNK